MSENSNRTDSSRPQFLLKASEIFADALDYAAGDLREAFITRACFNDEALLVKVRSMLAKQERRDAHGHASPRDVLSATRLSNAMADALANDTAALGIDGAGGQRDKGSESHWIGRRVGNYKITAEIARGGMGSVFEAVRDDDAYEKIVAIKLIRANLADALIAQRFRAERQILANLDHPHIARLLDGGQSDDGTPFLVMEYVNGEPIDVYCQSRALPISDRLKLFRDVCSAVQFAHQRLVVHRDLKPNNILVDTAGQVKLLDFGIAKLVDGAQLDEHGNAIAMPTEANAMTPAYASPEQIKGEAITTSSDVYALGVLLYRLLTGRSPYKSPTTQPLALAKEIVETDPERPSTVVTQPESSRPTERTVDTNEIKKNLRTLDSKRLQKELRGDLDNVVLMALRKDPQRRYASAQQLAEDVKRYENDQPVAARTDTFRYRSSKFLSRNRWVVTAAAIAAVSLSITTGVATHQASEARHARGVAEKNAGESRELANDSLFEIHTLIQDLPGSEPARKRLIEKAVQQLERLETQSGLANTSADLGWGWFRLAELQGGFSGRNIGDKAGAERNYQRAIPALTNALNATPKDDALAARVVLAYRAYGVFLAIHGKADESLKHFDDAVRIAEPLIKQSPRTQRLRLNLATTLIFRSQYGAGGKRELVSRIQDADQARLLLLALLAELPADTELRDDTEGGLMASMQRLASLETERPGTSGHSQALIWSEQAVVLAERRLLKSPYNTRLAFNAANVIGGLANIYFETSRAKQAIPYAKRSLELFKQVSAASPADNSAAISVLMRAAVLAMAQVDVDDNDGAKVSTDDFALRWQNLPEAVRNIAQAQSARNFTRIADARLLARASTNVALPIETRLQMCLKAIEETKTVRAYAVAHPETMSAADPSSDMLRDSLIDLQRCKAVTVVPKI
jgi:eukaryotic-like serine/threonine-protein kinase